MKSGRRLLREGVQNNSEAVAESVCGIGQILWGLLWAVVEGRSSER